ncbi:MAG TPA: hypothetical protein VHZ76_01035 [Gammaproteobacteria bacterium]|jgi:hypothetical protein|nr:hypothetical protein [Gammaproteobacteria bacterium]
MPLRNVLPIERERLSFPLGESDFFPIKEKSLNVDFFISNNTEYLNVFKSYEKLHDATQEKLYFLLMKVLKKNHIQPVSYKNTIGVYSIVEKKYITTENTIVLSIPLHKKEIWIRIFSIAQNIASALKQESVAVFAPIHNGSLNKIVVNFSSFQPTVTTIFNRIKEKIPALYERGFTMHLKDKKTTFYAATVTKIDFLAAQFEKEVIDLVKEVFYEERILFYYGKSFLVCQNGEIKRI